MNNNIESESESEEQKNDEQILDNNNVYYDTIQTIDVVGGNKMKHSLGINTKTISYIDNIMDDWKYFNEEYINNNKIDDKYTQQLMNEITDVLLIDFPIKINLLPVFLKKVYEFGDDELFNKLRITLFLHDPIHHVIKHIYFNLVKFYEQKINKYIEARNIYLLNKKTEDKKNNYEEIYNKWSKWLTKNNLTPTSQLLFMITPVDQLIKSNLYKKAISNATNEKDLPPIIRLKIKNNKSVDMFVEKLQNYNYKSLCPQKPIESLLNLFTFPIDELINSINSISDSKIIVSIDELYNKIDNLCKNIPIKPLIKFQEKKYKSEHNNKKNNNLDECIKYTSKILMRYKQLEDQLIEIEKYYSELGRWFAKLNNLMNEILIN